MILVFLDACIPICLYNEKRRASQFWLTFSHCVSMEKTHESCSLVIKTDYLPLELLISTYCLSIFKRSLSRARQTSLVQVLHLFIFSFARSAMLLTVATHAAGGRRVYRSLKANSRSLGPFPLERRKMFVLLMICCCCWGWQCGTILKHRETRFCFSSLSDFCGANMHSSSILPAWDMGSRWFQTNRTRPDSGEVHTAVSVNNNFF